MKGGSSQDAGDGGDASAPATEESAWNNLREAMASGEIAVLDVFRQGHAEMVPDGDHEWFVNYTRATLMLMSDERILRRMASEIDSKIAEREGKQAKKRIEDQIAGRDGHRLFSKLTGINAELYGDSPSLLPRGTFAECLGAYNRLIGHVESLWTDACRHFREQRYPLAAFLAILAIEETGKLGRLWHDLLAWDTG